jgi:hypothetical protein
MADYAPVYSGGAEPFTATTSGAVTGGKVLAQSGEGTVAHAGADSTQFVGVAAHDAPSGGRVTVWPIVNVIHELTASGAIAAGAGVQTAAAGDVKTAVTSTAAAAAGALLVGIALGAAANNKVRVLGRA